MISSIRNPWIRRSLVLLLAPFYVLFLLVIGIADALETSAVDLLHAWKGRRG